MSSDLLTAQELIDHLRRKVRNADTSISAYAIRHGIPRQYLINALNHNAVLGPAVLAPLGWERVVLYRKR